MTYDYYEDHEAPLDELAYGRCKKCRQLEELNADDLCLVCEGLESNAEFRKPTR